MMSQNDCRHWKISTGRHFQNGHHNTTQIQHCSISMPFHIWVDYDVPNWFLISKNFYRSPFSKWPPQYITNYSTLSDFNSISYMGRLWCPELIPDIDFNVLNWLRTSKNFYRSPFSKWPPQYLKNSKLSNIIKIWYVGK